MDRSGSHLIFVTGGARSGKSAYAERLAMQLSGQCGGRVVYLATCEVNDPEMVSRVTMHRAKRSGSWTTVECPLEVAAAVREHGGPAAPDAVFLLDCVSFWVSNLIFSSGDHGGAAPPEEGFNYDDSLLTAEQERAASRRVSDAVDDLLAALAETGVMLITVTNEVGMGVVPEYPLARLYRDQLGWANQRLAAAAGRAVLLVSGLALDLKVQPPADAQEVTR
ncbi:MAG TPA: bifunctional adenosylcobinamide kinase/adenosylcobinamide-phosphate guanylyltransferase [Thermoleophilia bacterium]|nr:bifunctional adenosylcobinamide kinase/adenosylcobinamide-phosphate guanylyltransferase [Thermoleophilia bacterium]HQJ98243.1 bifunctional adenosylcobinamide kinase/adenosylcobinamide-phosphate guanylyltransferase [Thermoleophilia bacterium]